MMDYKPSHEYHKGSLCMVKYQICQEGYCSECRISLEQLKLPRPEKPTKKAAPVLSRAAIV